MNSSEEVAILRQTYALCSTHRDALKDALQDLDLRKLTALDLENLSRQDRRLLDQFAYRYTRLQDDIGHPGYSRPYYVHWAKIFRQCPCLVMRQDLDFYNFLVVST